MHATVVIGANYGDEGKGLMTDYLAAQAGSRGLVVRFNGGAQAGHTVETPGGRRHAFAHYGSGTFVGADTLLTRDFLVNPMLYVRERQRLQRWGVKTFPAVWIDTRAYVTTPYDALINETLENARGQQRHGSVAVGIHETMVRSQQPQFRLTYGDLRSPRFVDTLLRIRHDWVPHRLAQFGLLPTDPRFMDEGLFNHWVEDVATMRATTIGVTDTELLQTDFDTVIFEGAQGLLLDPEYGEMPYCTHSNTGLKNVVPLLQEARFESVAVIYMTRQYLTRHGAGPLAHELPQGILPYVGVEDRTNTPGAYQGHLRFAPLDLGTLEDRVDADLGKLSGSGLSWQHELGITCMDQLGDEPAVWFEGGNLCTGNPDAFLWAAQAILSPSGLFISSGPTREHVTQHDLSLISNQ